MHFEKKLEQKGSIQSKAYFYDFYISSIKSYNYMNKQNFGQRIFEVSTEHKCDSIQGTDYIANPFFLNLKVSRTTIQKLR